MTSRFLNVFSDLDIDEDLRELISETEVVRISTNTVKSSLHIFIDGGSELPKDKLFKLQSELKQSLFGGKNICVSILRERRPEALPSDVPFDGGRAVGAYKENGDALPQGPSNGASFNASQGAASTGGSSSGSTKGNAYSSPKGGTVSGKVGEKGSGSNGFKARSFDRGKRPGQQGFAKKDAWTPKKTKKSDDPDVIFGYDFSGNISDIANLTVDMGEVLISGEIFSREDIKTKSGRIIAKFNLYDGTDSIGCSLFLSEEELEAISGDLKEGKHICVLGRVMPPDNFHPDLSIGQIKGAKRAKSRIADRIETYEGEKRVELNLHTKMSDMDGVGEIKNYIKLAQSFGEDSLAITDLNTVQAFPEASHCLPKGSGFKLIYGTESFFCDDEKKAVSSPRGQSLKGGFVVFDIETTGFSMEHCRIIEIGAVKIENGVITDRFSHFIDPEVPIPKNITELTSITDEDVRGQGNYQKWLPEFLSFVGELPVVGHNAQFDVGFIRHYAKLLGLSFEPTVVDTLGLSYMLLKDLYRNRLDTVAKELNVVLSSHHRAVNDAEATAGIFLRFCDMLRERGIEDLDALYEADDTDRDVVTVKKLHGLNFSMLATCDLGRTNMYRLISAAHIDYFHNTAKLPKSLLSSLRAGILIGSGDADGELYDMVLRGFSDEELDRAVAFYDYVEVLPPDNLRYLIDSDDSYISSMEDIYDVTRRLISSAERVGRPACAVGDVHFVNESDKAFRKIIKYFEYSSKGRARLYSDAKFDAPQYYRSTAEMLEAFSFLPEDEAKRIVIDNTRLIADMCEPIAPVRPDKRTPVIENSDEELRQICYDKAHELYGEDIPAIVKKRLDTELDSIIKNGYSVLYIIAQRLVWDSNDHGYLVGSRGSVGSSFVATCAGISEVNPLPPHYYCKKCHYSDFDSDTVKEYADKAGCDMPDKLCPVCGEPLIKEGFDIPFETFLGFKGDKEPDIDLNFAGDYQAKAHAYTEEIFGRGQTFKAGTIGTVQLKTAYGYVKRYNEDHEINDMKRAEIERLAIGCTEVRRTTGQHPGGIIVLPHGEEINSFTPIQHPANDMQSPITTHFDYHSLDHNLLKLDILGKDDPSMARMLKDMTGLDPMDIPIGVPEVLSLFQDTSALGIEPEDIGGTKLGTLAIPEFNTDFAINMLLDAKPKYISDLVRIAGLAHGTDVWIGNAKDLIQEGKCTIQTAICTRDDIMLYLISKGMEPGLSFTIMEAVRKGKFVKNDKHEEWCAAMREHGVPEWYIESCDKIKYMFPKAHAAAYVVMSLRLAYYKIHFPAEFYTAYFTIKGNGFDYEKMDCSLPVLRHNMKEFKETHQDGRNQTANDKLFLRDMRVAEEMLARGIEFAPIDIYKAKATEFSLTEDKKVMPSLNSITGLGDIAARSIEEEAKKGEFLSMEEFIQRTHISKTNAEQIKALGLLKSIPETNQLSLFDLI